jgi:hypothetical protein
VLKICQGTVACDNDSCSPTGVVAAYVVGETAVI